MLTILKHFLLTGIDGRKAIRRIAQPQPEGLAFIGAWGCASTSRKTIRSMEAEWMVFRICITGALLASIIPNWV